MPNTNNNLSYLLASVDEVRNLYGDAAAEVYKSVMSQTAKNNSNKTGKDFLDATYDDIAKYYDKKFADAVFKGKLNKNTPPVLANYDDYVKFVGRDEATKLAKQGYIKKPMIERLKDTYRNRPLSYREMERMAAATPQSNAPQVNTTPATKTVSTITGGAAKVETPNEDIKATTKTTSTPTSTTKTSTIGTKLRNVAKGAGKAAKGAGIAGTALSAGLLFNDMYNAYQHGGWDEVQRMIPTWATQYGAGTVGAAIGAEAGSPAGVFGAAIGGLVGGYAGTQLADKMPWVQTQDYLASERNQTQNAAQPTQKAQPTAQQVAHQARAQQVNQQPTNARAGIKENPVPTGQPYTMNEIQQYIVETARKYGVDPAVALAVAQNESGFRPSATSGKGAQGVFQLMPATARELGVQNPYDWKQNVDGGIRYLKQMMNRYPNSLNTALAGYNAGMGNVDRYGGVPPFAETRNYIDKIASTIPDWRGRLNHGTAVPAQEVSNQTTTPQANNAPAQAGGQATMPEAWNTLSADQQNAILAALGINQADTTAQAQADEQAQRMLQSIIDSRQQTADQFSQVANMLTDAQTGSAANQQRIQDTLNRAYQDRLNMIRTQGPEYQGDVLTPTNPYNIDIDELRRNQAVAAGNQWYDFATGKNPKFDPSTFQQQQALEMYRQQLANQAGVPYEEYHQTIVDRNKQSLEAQKWATEQALKYQYQNATDATQRAKILADMYDANQTYNQAIDKEILSGQLDLQKQGLINTGDLQKQRLINQGNLAQTNLSGTYDLTQENMRQNNPYTNFSRMMSGLGWGFGTNPRGTVDFIRSLPKEMQNQMFPNMTPEMLQRMSNPTYGNQASQSGLTNTLNTAWKNWLNRNAGGGLQANEQ